MHPALSRYLESLAAAGVRRIPRPAVVAPGGPGGPQGVADESSPTASPPSSPESRAGAEAAASAERRTASHFAALIDDALPARPADPAAALARIDAEVLACRACSLCETRTNAVPGEGSPDARVLFVGEGPGADEDRSGRPFVGRAGKLLDDIITKGMKLRRADVFIANVVKCRPPQNRAPLPDEVAACRGFLERQIAAVAPDVVCSLGATATHLLLQTDQPMGRLRGRAQTWRGVTVIPTYHPAYLLRSPAAKKPTWDDIQQVMKRIGS